MCDIKIITVPTVHIHLHVASTIIIKCMCDVQDSINVSIFL